jgi:capsular exopolysaccharide synthesis family protein
MQPIAKEERTDFSYLLRRTLNKWYWYAITLAAFLAVAFFINNYAPKKYRVAAKILIPQSRGFVNSADVLPGFEQLLGLNNFQNEMQMLRSFPLVKNTVKNLGFEISYYQKDTFFKKELYKNAPFLVSFDRQYGQPVGVEFKIKILDENRFHITADQEDVSIFNIEDEREVGRVSSFSIDEIHSFDDELVSNDYKFKIVMLSGYDIEKLRDHDYFFRFNNLDDLAMDMRNLLDVRPATTTSTVANIDFELNNVNKALAFLERWCNEYIIQSQERKNEVAISTLAYIDNQLSRVSDSLNLSSEALQQYRTRHNIIDITTQVTSAYTQLQELETQEADLDVRNKYYLYLNEYFTSNRDTMELVAPSSMGITDQSLNDLVQEYILTNNQRKILIDKGLQNSIQFRDLSITLENLDITIRESIRYSLNTSQIALDEVRARLARLRREVNQMPATERALVGIQREFRLNETTYNFLLQKRVDAQIAQESNMPAGQIIEPARLVTKAPVWPNAKLNYILALFLGLVLPFGTITVTDLIDTKIRDGRHINLIGNYQVVGKIGVMHGKKGYNVFERPDSDTAEMFRILRTNLINFGKVKDPKVILITSSIANDGKSFIALNLALAYAGLRRKTLLANCDLRNPSLDRFLDSGKEKGMSSFLAGSTPEKDVIIPSGFENLWYTPAGPVPPDPLEFISSTLAASFFEKRRKEFDVVIIDTSPSGYFSDGSILTKFADHTLMVVRINHTPRKILEETLQEFETNNIANVDIVLNQHHESLTKYSKYYKNYRKAVKR